mgnify:CR=1 FL=1|tara:strand:+ start:2001 stop:3821 length:1821 start_codon:yes stop_codon:yes gene_type:complete
MYTKASTKLPRFLLIIIVLISSNFILTEITEEQERLLESLPVDQRAEVLKKLNQANKLNKDLEETFEQENLSQLKPELADLEDNEGYCEDCIYGFNIFRFAPSTFAPANKVPLTSTYTLGPGDKLEVSLFGSVTDEAEAFIDRDGSFKVPELGNVNLAGLTFAQAKDLVSNKVENQLPGTRVSLSLSELRSINIYILGEAYQPGSYTVSALTTVTNALFKSGGVNENGSLRTIEIKRKGETVRTYDFYDLILKGNIDTDINLEDGDTIFIPFYENIVNVKGSFKRSGKFEFIEGETINDAIQFAGGFNSNVLGLDKVELSRVSDKTYERILSDINKTQFDQKLINGDLVTASEIGGIDPRSVEILGEIKNPGTYSIGKTGTLLDLIQKAGGYTDKAYIPGVIFTREQVAKQQKDSLERSAQELEKVLITSLTNGVLITPGAPLTEFALAPISSLINDLRQAEPPGRQVIKADLLTLKSDPYANIFLEDGDKIYVPKRPDSVQVVGEVVSTVTAQFNPKYTIMDYLQKAGGTTDEANERKIYVIFPNGESSIYKKSFFNSGQGVLPGSTIVVTRKSRVLDGVSIAQIVIPVLADLSVTAAAISNINN